MTRLDRYVAREMVAPFLVGQAAVALMLTGTVLYNNADVFLSYRIPADGIARIALYFLPYLVNLTMPVAVAVAASLAVSRLCRDSEITAMRAAGIPLKRIFRVVLIAGVGASVLDFYLGEKLVPWATRKYDETISSLSREVKFLAPQERQLVRSPDRKYTAYIERIAPGSAKQKAVLEQVTLTLQNDYGVLEGVIFADKAEYDNGVWTMQDARSHLFAAGGETYRYIRGKSTIDFRLAESVFSAIALQLPLYSPSTAMSFAELRSSVIAQRSLGWVNHQDLLDLQLKASVPASCLVFAIVCPPLAFRFSRAGAFTGLLLSVVLVFVYWNLLLASKILGSQFPTQFPPLVAAWGQGAVFAAAGLLVRWRSE